jgi:hypothetical protein
MRADVCGFVQTETDVYKTPAISAIFVERSGAGVEPTEPWVTRPHWF